MFEQFLLYHSSFLNHVKGLSKEHQSENPTKKLKNFSNHKRINLKIRDLENVNYEPSNRKPWTQEEDQLLKSSESSKKTIKSMAKQFQGRTEAMCYSRNKRLKFGSKPKWGSELNQIIKDFVLHNELSWDKHEDSFYLKKFKKSRRQVIDHYDNFLRQGLNFEKWTKDEDIRLITVLKKNSDKSWKQINKQFFYDRSEYQLKNRYHELKRFEQKMI